MTGVSLQTFDPKKRVTVEEALAHPYLEAYVRIIFPSTRQVFVTNLGMGSLARP